MGTGVGALIVLVGLPTSGKTTRARQIQRERGALRLTPDEWMIPLFAEPEADGRRAVLEGRFIWLAMEALRSGIDVVLDFGVWSRDERSALRSLAAEIAAPCELVYLAVGLEDQLERMVTRRAVEPDTAFDINEADLRAYADRFEEPSHDELEGGAIPSPPSGFRSWRDWAAARWPTSMASTP